MNIGGIGVGIGNILPSAICNDSEGIRKLKNLRCTPPFHGVAGMASRQYYLDAKLCNAVFLGSLSMGSCDGTEWTSFRILKDEVEVRLFVKPSMYSVSNNHPMCLFSLCKPRQS